MDDCGWGPSRLTGGGVLTACRLSGGRDNPTGSRLKAAPADPYAAGEVPLRQIGQYDVTSDLEAPIRVRGTVAAKESGGLVDVSDGETSVAIQ
jgi:hypothetical protein